MASGSNQLSALLIGGTGATGKEVLKELSKNELISKIFFISRRAVEFPEHPKVNCQIISCSSYAMNVIFLSHN